MKKYLLFILLVLTLTLSAQQKNFIDQNYIEVTGVAEMEIIPNEIYLKIILDENDFKNKVSLIQMEKTLLEILQGLKIEVKKDLSVLDMTSNFKTYWVKNKDIKTVKEFQLKVSDAKTAGSVMRELEAKQISNIQIIRVDHSELDKFKNDVKIRAIKSARFKAENLAEAIGQKCGRAIYIHENYQNVYGALQGRLAGLSANIRIKGVVDDGEESMPEIEFEKIKLESTVQVNFILE